MHCYFWEIVFEDGFHLRKFDSDGNEYLIKKDIPKTCYYIAANGQPAIDFNKNIWENLERVHGRAIEAAWIAFDLETKLKAQAKNRTLNIRIPTKGPAFRTKIPVGYFPYVHVSVGIDTQVTMTGGDLKVVAAKGQVAKLFLGYIPRQGTVNPGLIDEINISPTEAAA